MLLAAGERLKSWHCVRRDAESRNHCLAAKDLHFVLLEKNDTAIILSKPQEASVMRHYVGHQRCKAHTQIKNTNMGIMHNCDTELLEETNSVFDIRVSCDLVCLFTNDEDTVVNSQLLT